MAEIRYTRNLFLRGISAIYLFAFVSFYVQIPGLYGNNGLLPARSQLIDPVSRTITEKIHRKPTLLWFSPYLGLNTEYMMDLLALLGILLSFTALISQKFCNAPVFTGLWSLYYSLYQVGQTFMWFQWDILLLEVGFLSIFIAPLAYPLSSRKNVPASPTDEVSFFLVRWLSFRFMFASGVVKLQSNCPTWWKLSALNYHFESQPIPTPYAWYFHYMPQWVLKLGTAHAIITETAMPILFFFPVRSVRVFGFYWQLFLQICIIVSGNYNFFNLLTITMHFSLLDDSFFYKKKDTTSSSRKLLGYAVNVIVHAILLYYSVKYFNIRLVKDGFLDADIAFTRAQFDEYIKFVVPSTVYVGGIILLYLSVKAIINTISKKQELANKVIQLLVTLLYVSAGFFIFGVSLVPYSSLSPSFNSSLMPPLRKLHSRIEHLHLANAYGLFRRMTGVGGRPEVIIEGANNIEGPWLEYNFKYKPGHVNTSLPIVAPYQPRLDWQMWFAALGTYHQNPWIMSLAYRILDGEQSVLHLLDEGKLPFETAPKYLKASLYHYHYSPWSQRSSQSWWKREKMGEYFPIFSKDHSPLVDYLKTLKILDTQANLKRDNEQVLSWWKTSLDYLRQLVAYANPVVLTTAIFISGLAIIFTSSPRY